MAVTRTGYNSRGTPCSFLLFSLPLVRNRGRMGEEVKIREADFITATAELPVLTKTNTQESPDFLCSHSGGAKLETKNRRWTHSVAFQGNK